MDLKELAKALGLPETATEEEIKKAVEDAAKAAERLKEMEEKKPEDKPGEGGKPQEVAEVVANSTILSMLVPRLTGTLPSGTGFPYGRYHRS